MRPHAGYTLVELLVTTTLMLFLLLTVLAAYSQGSTLGSIVQSDATIQNSVRVAMGNLERELRMVGFWVPGGPEIGGTASWQPLIIHASPTEFAFRADIDGGNSLIVCNPDGSSSNCPLSKVLVSNIGYYQDLNCKKPDDAAQNMPMVLIGPAENWEAVACTGFSAVDNSVSVASAVTDVSFNPGSSRVVTLEQVYYRYVAGGDRLERYVRYSNTPDNTYPPTSPNWSLVANNIGNFNIEYQDATGTVLTGNPLSLAQRNSVARIVVTMEGLDRVGPVGPNGFDREISLRSQIMVRNIQ